MKEQKLLQRIKQKLASIAWLVFIWGNEMTDEEYFETIYELEKAHKKMNNIPL